jgi:hypothetical protein
MLAKAVALALCAYGAGVRAQEHDADASGMSDTAASLAVPPPDPVDGADSPLTLTTSPASAPPTPSPVPLPAPAIDSDPDIDAETLPTGSPSQAVRVHALAGAGFGTRSLKRPIRDGEQRLETALFAAIDAGLRVHVAPEEQLSLDVLLRYQSSLGLSVEERPLFALPREVSARAARAELSAAPTLQFGREPGSLALSVPLGVFLRSFVAEQRELLTPSYLLIGPLLRAELRAELTPWLSLRLGPEVALFVIDGDVRDDGVRGLGGAAGAEAAVVLQFSEKVALELSYRESHAFADAEGQGPDFGDVERFAIARLTGAL